VIGTVLDRTDQVHAQAHERQTANDTIANLQLALASNRRIGTAVGILMAQGRITDSAAFDLLRLASQHTHRKLRDIADEVILTGALPSD
jgi:AmiR/NasT family two-component response regulator